MTLARYFHLTFRRGLFILGLLCPFLGRAEDVFDAAGPFHAAYKLTLEAGSGEQFLGPFYSSQTTSDEREWGIHPLFSVTTNLGIDSIDWDSFYPVMSYHRYGTQSRWQFMQVLSFAGGENQEGVNPKRLTIFPFYFQQRSKDTNLNYTAVLPFYGNLENRIFMDRIQFVLFPLYVETQKRDVISDHYLMPFFQLRHGDHLEGWQFWPLVGNEVKGETSRTNSFGFVETEGPYRKFFAAWPFFFEENKGIGTTNWDKLHVFLPFYVVERSQDHDTSTYMWPFFTSIDNRALQYHEYGFAWPLFTIARGEGKKTTRVFPLFSHAENKSLKSDFFLWPLYKYNKTSAPPLESERTRLIFYLYSRTKEKNLSTGQTFLRSDFWPLFNWRHDLDGREKLQLLSILEPFLPNNKSVQRNYSPLYALWRSEKNPSTGSSSQSLLWNLYRADKTPKAKKQSFLFGLFQHESGPQGKQWRVFYVPLGKKTASRKETPTAPAKSDAH